MQYEGRMPPEQAGTVREACYMGPSETAALFHSYKGNRLKITERCRRRPLIGEVLDLIMT